MAEYQMDLYGVYTREELWDVVQEVLPLPDYFGRNLDALFDVLTECREPTTITIYHLEDSKRIMSKYMVAFQQVLEDAMDKNENLHVEFVEDDEDHS